MSRLLLPVIDASMTVSNSSPVNEHVSGHLVVHGVYNQDLYKLAEIQDDLSFLSRQWQTYLWMLHSDQLVALRISGIRCISVQPKHILLILRH